MNRTRTRSAIAIAAISVLGLVAAACGDDDDATSEATAADTATDTAAEAVSTEAPSADTEAEPASTEPATADTEASASDSAGGDDLTLYFIGATSTQSFSIEQSLGAEEAGKALDVEVVALAPTDPSDFATQVQLFNDAILEQPDGIVLFTLAPDQFVRPLADAAEAGIPVLAADVPLEGLPTVTNDNVGMGARLAEYVLADVPEDATGTVVIGSPQPGLPVLDLRADGIKQWVAENRPGLETTGPLETGLDPVQNTANWTDIVASNSDGVAFIGVGDQDAPSLAQIRRTNGGDWANAGFDLNDTALAQIEPGDLDAVGDPQHFLKGYIGIALLTNLLRDGTPLPDGLLLTTDNVVNADNVADIIERQTSPENRTAWYQEDIDEILTNPVIVPMG